MRGLRLPHAERWLARADIGRVDSADAAAWLGARFELPSPVPVAPVTLAYDDARHEGLWLRADPVYARIERDTMTLHHASVLDIERTEADAIVATLQSLFAADGLEFRAPRPDRWYVRVPDGELPDTTPLDEVLGRDVFRRLPRGGGRINWLAAITEVQMVLATHAVNLRRESVRKPPINCVWFWGGGCVPAVASTPYALIYAEEPFARGLAALASVRAASPPGKFPAVDAVRAGESVLVVLDELSLARRGGDEPAWMSAAQRIDDTWFATLDNALERFERVRIVLPTGRDTCVATITAGARWRLLRSRKPLASHA